RACEENLKPSIGGPPREECEKALHGQRPHESHDTRGGTPSSEMNLASSNSEWTFSTSSGGAGVSIERTISACPPCLVRDTVIFAMLTAEPPKSVPTLPMTPGTSSYRRTTRRGATSMSSSNPSALTSQRRLSLPMVVPANRSG